MLADALSCNDLLFTDLTLGLGLTLPLQQQFWALAKIHFSKHHMAIYSSFYQLWPIRLTDTTVPTEKGYDDMSHQSFEDFWGDYSAHQHTICLRFKQSRSWSNYNYWMTCALLQNSSTIHHWSRFLFHLAKPKFVEEVREVLTASSAYVKLQSHQLFQVSTALSKCDI